MTKTTAALPQYPLYLRWILSIWGLVIVISVLGGFAHLDASSLWMDELFTVYFSDPAQSSFATFLNRAAEDVHPPGYYAIVWAAGRFAGGDMTIVARAISAIAAGLSIVQIYFVMPSWVGRPARLFACTSAATSLIYFIYAQEARSYAVGWVLLLAMLGLALGILRTIASDRPIHWRLIPFTIAGAIAGLCHFYLVPVAGAIVAIMILFGRTWPNRFLIALSGLTILAAVAAVIGWQSDKIIADVSNTWFKADFAFLWGQTSLGLAYYASSTLESQLLFAVFFIGLLATGSITTKNHNSQNLKTVYADVSLLFGSAALGVLLAIMVTILYVPSFSYRMFLLLAPVYWIVLGILVEAILRSSLKPIIPVLLIFATLIFSTASLRVAWREFPRKHPWRASATFITELESCRDAALPVVTFATPFISQSEPRHFYGYYMPDGATRDWISHPENKVLQFPQGSRAEDIVARRIVGTDPCPILLWSISHAKPAELAALSTTLGDQYSHPVGTTIVLKTVHLQDSTPMMQLLSISFGQKAYILMVERDVK